MKKFFLITCCILLILGFVVMVLHKLYLPFWDQRAFVRQLERAGYAVSTITATNHRNLPFSNRISAEYRQVPEVVCITEHADLTLLPKIGANAHVSILSIGQNLPVEELRHLRSLRLEHIEIVSVQDPTPFFASGLDLTGRVELLATQNPISPDWLEGWLKSGHIDEIFLAGDEKLRPLLPLVFETRSFYLEDIPLNPSDLKGLHGTYDSILLKNTGAEPSWIPKDCRGRSISLLGNDIKPMDLDPLIGRFTRIYANSSVDDEKTIKVYAKWGVQLHPYRPVADEAPPKAD